MTIKEKRPPFKPKPLNHKGKSPGGPVQTPPRAIFPKKKAGSCESRPFLKVAEATLLVLFFFFLLVLLLGPAQRRAENVAEASARIGRAEIGHRLLLLVELTRLDRQHHPARGPVDVGDLGVELVADRIAVGTLLGAV